MSRASNTRLPVAVALGLTGIALAGCTNPDAPTAARGPVGAGAGPQPAGEPPAPGPRSNGGPVRTRAGVVEALSLYARLYTNWTYRTLALRERELIAMSTGSARLSEQQARASASTDTTIARGELRNSGSVLAVAPEASGHGRWVIVTREQTSGNSRYTGLPATYHVTLARPVHLQSGWAIGEWSPQS